MTFANTLALLRSGGFTDHFRIDNGSLRAVVAERRFRPEELCVTREHLVRSPDGDLSLIMGLDSPDREVRGTLCVPFGARATKAVRALLEALPGLRLGAVPA